MRGLLAARLLADEGLPGSVLPSQTPPGKQAGLPKCSARSVRVAEADASMWSLIVGRIKGSDAIEDARSPEGLAEELGRLRVDADMLRAKMDRLARGRSMLVGQIARGLLDDEEADKALREAKHDREDAQARLDSIQATLRRSERRARDADVVACTVEALRDRLDDPDDVTKREIVEAISRQKEE